MHPDHVLLVGFGGPARPDDVMPFIQQVAGQSRIPESRLREVAHHYEAVGGSSPYLAHTRRLAESLRAYLCEKKDALPVFVGMRHWHPFLHETVGEIKRLGHEQGIALILAPHRSAASCFHYKQALTRALEKNGIGKHGLSYEFLDPWYDHPLFIKAQTDLIGRALMSDSDFLSGKTAVIFSAHSIPAAMDRSCRACCYSEEVTATARLTAQQLKLPAWQVAYQSRSGDPRSPWLGPDILEAIRQSHDRGYRRILVAPIGFLSDHVEVLYDLDVEARELTEKLGMAFARVPTLGNHPDFVAMLGDLIFSGMQADG